MERRSAWTDARLDDRFDQIDRRFDQVDRRFDRLESEIREGFSGVRSDIGDLRNRMDRFLGGMMVGLLGLIAAVLARGV